VGEPGAKRITPKQMTVMPSKSGIMKINLLMMYLSNCHSPTIMPTKHAA